MDERLYQENRHRSGDTHNIQSAANGHTTARRTPDTSRGGQTGDRRLVAAENHACPQKTNTRYNARCDTRGVELDGLADHVEIRILGHDHHKRRGDGNDKVCAQTG